MSGDEREHVRIDAALEFQYWTDTIFTPARIEDLSEGGAFVDTPNPLPEGDQIDFKLTLPDSDEPIVGRARVIWQQRNVGMGIRFIGLSTEQREQIKFYIAAQFFKSF